MIFSLSHTIKKKFFSQNKSTQKQVQKEPKAPADSKRQLAPVLSGIQVNSTNCVSTVNNTVADSPKYPLGISYLTPGQQTDYILCKYPDNATALAKGNKCDHAPTINGWPAGTSSFYIANGSCTTMEIFTPYPVPTLPPTLSPISTNVSTNQEGLSVVGIGLILGTSAAISVGLLFAYAYLTKEETQTTTSRVKELIGQKSSRLLL